MEYTQRMNDLDVTWKLEHQKEVEDPRKSTRYKSVDKGNYKKDGVVDFEKYFSSPNRILLLMEESNDPKDGDGFWFQEMYQYRQGVYTREIGKGEKITFSKYNNRFYEMYNTVFNDGDKLKKEEWIEICAYMNLNKRGGRSIADINIIKNYISKFHDLIKQQIKILNPTMIFFCCKEFNPREYVNQAALTEKIMQWNAFFDEILGSDFLNNETCSLFYFPHPASRKKNCCFKEQIETCFTIQS